jgi:hypothetical protein
MKMFRVEGGVYTNNSFDELVPGTEEVYGPFDNYEEAYNTWSSASRANLDNCCHRLVIKEI